MTIITDITTSRNKAYIINSDRYTDDPRLPNIPAAAGCSLQKPTGLFAESLTIPSWGWHVIYISVGIYYLMYFLMIIRAMLANMNPAAAPINAPAIISPR